MTSPSLTLYSSCHHTLSFNPKQGVRSPGTRRISPTEKVSMFQNACEHPINLIYRPFASQFVRNRSVFPCTCYQHEAVLLDFMCAASFVTYVLTRWDASRSLPCSDRRGSTANESGPCINTRKSIFPVHLSGKFTAIYARAYLTGTSVTGYEHIDTSFQDPEKRVETWQ